MDKFKLMQVVLLALFPLSGIAQKVEIVETGGIKYAAINAVDLPRKTEDRSTNSNFYVEVDLYKYSSGSSTPEAERDDEGNIIKVKRVGRHCTGENKYPNSSDYTVSKRFIVSPTMIYSDGTTSKDKGGAATMDWATANGYLAAANSTSYTISASATPMGCPKYKGKDGRDTEGTWRVPTHKEGMLIAIFYKELEQTSAETGFEAFAANASGSTYWLSTEDSGYSSNAWFMRFYTETKASQYQIQTGSKTTKYSLRCIRDIAVE